MMRLQRLFGLLLILVAASLPAAAQDGPKKPKNEGDQPKVVVFSIGADHVGVEVVKDGKRLPVDELPARDLIDTAMKKGKLSLLGVLRYDDKGAPQSYYCQKPPAK